MGISWVGLLYVIFIICKIVLLVRFTILIYGYGFNYVLFLVILYFNICTYRGTCVQVSDIKKHEC